MTSDYFARQAAPAVIAARLADFGGWFEIDLDRLTDNLAAIRARTGVEVMPVVKNDAYGHGLIPITAALAEAGVEWVMVAKTSEALAIKQEGIDCQVVNMDCLYSDAQARRVVGADITQVVYTTALAGRMAAAAAALGRKAGIFVKVDTGLRRIGVADDQAVALIEEFAADANLELRGVFSTFMEEPDQDEASFARFQAVLDGLLAKGIDPGLRSIGSSNAVFHYPDSWLDMVRPATALYGIYPEEADRGAGLELRQTLTFKARVEHLKWIEAGQSVTYHGRFVAPEAMRIATLHVGFYDGIPREMTNKARIRVGDVLTRSVGSISLNNCLFDATGLDVEVGDVVEVYGRDSENDVASTAREAGWMTYSVLNHLNPFLPRVYMRAGQPVALLERSVA